MTTTRAAALCAATFDRDGHIVTWRQLSPAAKHPAGARVLTLAEVAAEIERLPAPPQSLKVAAS